MGRISAVRTQVQHHPRGLVGEVVFRRALLVCGILALVAASCGGDDGPASVESDATFTAGGDEGADPDGEGGFTASSDDAALQVGDDDRPDWLPPWVVLPEGLDITLAFDDGATGESAVTGFVIGADPRELYDDALSMVQSGGYLAGEEQQTSGVAFNADHASDGSLVRFAAIEIDAETVQWSLEFAGRGGTDESAERAGEDETATPAGSAVLTITIADETWTTAGTCDLPFFDFQSDDGVSNISVLLDDPDYGDFAVGTVARTIEGGEVERWTVGNSMNVVRADNSGEALFFEGDMSQGDRLENAVIEVDCG